MTGHRFPRRMLCTAAAAAALLATGMTTAATAAVSRHCVAHLNATFGRGPDAGLSIVGKMSITLTPEGRVTGELTRSGEPKPIAIGGMLRNKRLLGLSFDLPSGLRVFATGRSFHLVGPCDDLPMGGQTHGPRPGDTGEWSNAFWHHA